MHGEMNECVQGGRRDGRTSIKHIGLFSFKSLSSDEASTTYTSADGSSCHPAHTPSSIAHIRYNGKTNFNNNVR